MIILHCSFRDCIRDLPILNAWARILGGLHIDHNYAEEDKKPSHSKAYSVDREVSNQIGAFQVRILYVHIYGVNLQIFTQCRYLQE